MFAWRSYCTNSRVSSHFISWHFFDIPVTTDSEERGFLHASWDFKKELCWLNNSVMASKIARLFHTFFGLKRKRKHESFTSLALCEGNPLMTCGSFQWPVMRNAFAWHYVRHDVSVINSAMQHIADNGVYHLEAILGANILTDWDRDWIDAFLQMTFVNVFSFMKMFEFR